jgi:replicative DNA helicase
MADVIIAKHRNGPTGEIRLKFIHNLTKFENLPVDAPTGVESSLL